MLDKLCDYVEHVDELIEDINNTEKVDFNSQMDELEELLNKNDKVLGEIKKSLKSDFMEKLEALG